jgi:hypothetical protein
MVKISIVDDKSQRRLVLVFAKHVLRAIADRASVQLQEVSS